MQIVGQIHAQEMSAPSLDFLPGTGAPIHAPTLGFFTEIRRSASEKKSELKTGGHERDKILSGAPTTNANMANFTDSIENFFTQKSERHGPILEGSRRTNHENQSLKPIMKTGSKIITKQADFCPPKDQTGWRR